MYSGIQELFLAYHDFGFEIDLHSSVNIPSYFFGVVRGWRGIRMHLMR